MSAARILILGCGFTGTRIARSLVATGHQVTVASRHPESIPVPGAARLYLDLARPETLRQLRLVVPQGALVLHSIPPGDVPASTTDSTAALMNAIVQARRVVYLSTTGVYGSQQMVDECTSPDPSSARARGRLAVERAVLEAPNSLVLRPAAIYGPGRGIHAALRAGTFRLWGEGQNFVSRIHVDDLSAHCIAGLFSEVTGAWPVADEEPCTSREIAEFCAGLLGVPLPPSAAPQELTETRHADRRVDGCAIRRALGIQLRYPSYRTGVPACIAEETGTPAGPLESTVRAL